MGKNPKPLSAQVKPLKLQFAQVEPPEPQFAQVQPLKPQVAQVEPLKPHFAQVQPFKPQFAQVQPLCTELRSTVVVFPYYRCIKDLGNKMHNWLPGSIDMPRAARHELVSYTNIFGFA